MGRGRRGIYILLEESQVPRPCIQVPPTPLRPRPWQRPAPPPAAMATPRPLASTRVRRPCFRVAHPSQPGQAPPPRGPGRGSRPRSRARASSSPHTPSPAARPRPSPWGSGSRFHGEGSRPAAAGCAPVPLGPLAAAAAQREEACPTPATGRQWRRPATGAAWLRERCCSAPRGRGLRADLLSGAAADRADTRCRKCVSAAWRGPLCAAVGGSGRMLWDLGIPWGSRYPPLTAPYPDWNVRPPGSAQVVTEAVGIWD